DKAGIEAGDVITEVNGQRVHSGEGLIVKTRAHRPGDRLELTLERGGGERTGSLVLGSSDGRRAGEPRRPSARAGAGTVPEGGGGRVPWTRPGPRKTTTTTEGRGPKASQGASGVQ